MLELAIAPSGDLILRTESTASGEALSSEAIAAFEAGTASGLLHAAELLPGRAPSAAFEFAGGFARLAIDTLARAAAGDLDGQAPKLPPLPEEELERLVLRAPPMVGIEYLTGDVLAGWWLELGEHLDRDIARHPAGLRGYLGDRDPRWRSVGRVTFHLAENKRDPDHPFAFLATYATGLSQPGRMKHEPLGRAIQQFAGANDRAALLRLLLPVSKAAESIGWVRRLVDDGDIERPLAWTPREAYEFLRSIPALEASGLIVRVPDWWNARKPSRPIVGVKVEIAGGCGLGVDALLRYSVDVGLDGESLDESEIAALLASSGGLVPLRGKWVEVDRDKLKQAIDHWRAVERKVRSEGLTFFEGMRLLSGASLSETGPPTLREEAVREWSGLRPGSELDAILAGLRSPESLQQAAPPGLNAELRPYQRSGVAWLRFAAKLRLGACLADDMGLGKTIQVIALLLDLKRDAGGRASLLVLPASLLANWKVEVARFAPGLRFGIVHPSEPAASQPSAATADGYDLVATTYGLLQRTEWLRERLWQLAILDEAQAIKNSGSMQTRAVKTLVARSRLALTGTPIENRLSDLWSLFDFLNPGLLGTAKQFATFAKRLQGAESPSYEPLRNLVRPYILRRMKTDRRIIADLPDKTEVDAYCTLSKLQAALYRSAVDDLAVQLKNSDGIHRRGLVLAQLMRLKQICNHPAQATGTNDYDSAVSGKFRRLGELAAEIASRQEKVLVFTQFREIADPLAEHLAGIFGRPGLVLHGGTAMRQRREVVDRFQTEFGPPFFVLSLKAAGTGLNLTAASHVIHFDRWWNPATENQATDRAFRIGQMKNVLVHKFVCRGTVEERIAVMIAEKAKVASEVTGTGDSGEHLLTEMDDASLLRFVGLDLNRAVDE